MDLAYNRPAVAMEPLYDLLSSYAKKAKDAIRLHLRNALDYSWMFVGIVVPNLAPPARVADRHGVNPNRLMTHPMYLYTCSGSPLADSAQKRRTIPRPSRLDLEELTNQPALEATARIGFPAIDGYVSVSINRPNKWSKDWAAQQYQATKANRALTVSEICERAGVSRKTLERECKTRGIELRSHKIKHELAQRREAVAFLYEEYNKPEYLSLYARNMHDYFSSMGYEITASMSETKKLSHIADMLGYSKSTIRRDVKALKQASALDQATAA
jgi:AraC-like DNA-binding protein